MEKIKIICFKKILFYNPKNEIKYYTKEPQLAGVNLPFYILIIELFKWMIDKESIKNLAFKNDSYFNYFFTYFKDLKRCLKDFEKFDQLNN